MDKFDKNLLDQYVERTSISVERHPTHDLFIYGYHSNLEESNIIWDEYNKHCRGLIIDNEGNVKARPFSKFFTYKRYLNENTLLLSENQIFNIPSGSFEIFEKVDGTMTTLYWVDDKPYLSTQRSFSNPNAVEATKILYEKYSHTFPKFKRDRTYIFEAIFPETNVLIDYGTSRDLYLIGVIDNLTSENLPLEDIGFPMAKNYTKDFGHINNFEELQNLDLPNQEGFVIVFENSERIKVKFPWYKEAHSIMSQILIREKQIFVLNRLLSRKIGSKNRHLSNYEIWRLLKENKNVDTVFNRVPETYYSVGVKFWIDEISNELNQEYKTVREEIKSKSDQEIWEMIRPKKIKYFTFDSKISDTVFSTPMWERIHRLKKLYI